MSESAEDLAQAKAEGRCCCEMRMEQDCPVHGWPDPPSLEAYWRDRALRAEATLYEIIHGPHGQRATLRLLDDLTPRVMGLIDEIEQLRELVNHD